MQTPVEGPHSELFSSPNSQPIRNVKLLLSRIKSDLFRVSCRNWLVICPLWSDSPETISLCTFGLLFRVKIDQSFDGHLLGFLCIQTLQPVEDISPISVDLQF